MLVGIALTLYLPSSYISSLVSLTAIVFMGVKLYWGGEGHSYALIMVHDEVMHALCLTWVSTTRSSESVAGCCLSASAAEYLKKAHRTGAKFVARPDTYYSPAHHFMIVWPFICHFDLKQMDEI